MKNRYDNLLEKYNEEIIDLNPYNPILFYVTAFEIAKKYKDGDRVLEIGCGQGDSTVPVLERTGANLDLLDVSPTMIETAKEKLTTYQDRTSFVCEDAYEYLKIADPYDTIFSCWTIHNFPNSERLELLKLAYQNLTDDGMLVIAEKIYPENADLEKMLDHQNKRYRYMTSDKAREEMIAHEIQDTTDLYRIDEDEITKQLKEIGFSRVEIADRVERDAVLVAYK